MSISETKPELFISYRREDSSGHAGRLFDCMRERFGDETVFMDVTDIQPGVDFAAALDGALSSCRVVLVVIGTQWLTCADASGRRRLDDPDDHLRMEIVQALRRDAHVIPVLVRGAAMPRERDLPDELRPLARRQAHEVSDGRWSYDTEQLVRNVQNSLGRIGQDHRAAQATAAAAGARVVAERGRSVDPRRLGWGRLAAPAAVMVVVVGLLLSRLWSSGGARVEPVDAQSPRDAGAAAAGTPVVPPVAFERGPAKVSQARLPASGEARAGDALFKMLGGLVSPDAGGAHTIRLLMRTTNVRARYGFTITADSFRLIVDGRAMPPDEAPVEVIAMQSTTEAWVRFRIPAGASTVVLQVGDIKQATATIPLDLRSAATDAGEMPATAWRTPANIAVAVEKRAGPVVFNVDGMRLEHFADAVAQVQPEKLELSVKVRMKNVGAQYGAIVGPDLFRLLVDDVPLAPTKVPIQVLPHQESLDAEIVFVMPGTARTASLQFGMIDADTVRVPVDLSTARLP